MINDGNKPYSHPADPYAAKANFDQKEKILHTEGPPGLWNQISTLLISVRIIAVLIVLVRFL